MEERILQNPSDMIGEPRDRVEYHLQVVKKEVEDEKQDPVEGVELKQLEETTPDGKDPVVESNDKKRCLNAAPGELTTLLCHQSQKKFKQVASTGVKLESGTPDNGSITTVASIDNSTPEEGTGSSGKRSRSRWEPQSEDDGVEDDQSCKRKKTRWSNEDTQLKMLGPLQLPDFRKEFVVGYEDNPEIQGLKAELVEITRKLHGPLHDDRLEKERSPSPEPIYDNLGIILNTREARLRQKLVQKRQDVISKLIKSNQSFSTPPDYKPPKLFKKLYIPVKEYPEYNFVGLIIGPRGNTLKRMENETGAKIHIRGKGSAKTPNRSASSKEDLHVDIEADNQDSLDAAVAMVEKLLIPVEGRNEHKEAQLKELAKLKGTASNENVCYVCGDQGHLSYACPDLQSTFKANTRETCLRATPLNVISPQNHSVQGSGFGFSSISSQSTQQQRPEKNSLMNNIYVGNLPLEYDENRLSELFSPFGKILEAKIMRDSKTGISRQAGFIEFENAMDAQAAVTRMNGFRMNGGRVLVVMIARLLSRTECLGLSLFSKPSGPAGTSQSVRSQIDQSRPQPRPRPRPLHVMLPEQLTSLHHSSGRNLFSSTMNSQNSDFKKYQSFSPPSCCSSSDPSYSGKMHFSRKFSDQSVSLSGSSISESSGSQYESYFVTPPPHKAALPKPDH